MSAKRRPYKRIALVVSVCLIMAWAFLGTGASLAWFTDTSEEVENIFNVAEFDLEVSHRLDDLTYEEVTSQTAVLDDSALYEPGYVQVAVLRVTNKGTVPFDLKTAVTVLDYTIAYNVYGQPFNLQEHLRFGLVTAPTEAALDAKLLDREAAVKNATMLLNNYTTDDDVSLDAGASLYMALIVRMPTEVDNVANYRGDIIPRVDLGLTFTATQQKR